MVKELFRQEKKYLSPLGMDANGKWVKVDSDAQPFEDFWKGSPPAERRVLYKKIAGRLRYAEPEKVRLLENLAQFLT